MQTNQRTLAIARVRIDWAGTISVHFYKLAMSFSLAHLQPDGARNIYYIVKGAMTLFQNRIPTKKENIECLPM